MQIEINGQLNRREKTINWVSVVKFDLNILTKNTIEKSGRIFLRINSRFAIKGPVNFFIMSVSLIFMMFLKFSSVLKNSFNKPNLFSVQWKGFMH